jgi:hypothetical protein
MVSLEVVKQAKKKLRQQIRKLEAVEKGLPLAEKTDQERKSHRDASAAFERKKSLEGRTVVIPKLTDTQRARRRRLEKNIFKWLAWYFADIFTYKFTSQQRAMIQAIADALEFGGDQALAASRGEGKTTDAECVVCFCVLTGKVKFAVLFSATGSDAEHSLDSIKDRLETNDRLHEYYPEVCVPLRALENTPNRAHYQMVKVNGDDAVPSRFSWCGREIVMPHVPGSRCAGSIIATRGLDAAIRGIKIHNKRPDLAVIDDPDTDDTVNSEEQAIKLEKKIDRAIAGLAGQKRHIARVMLTTIQRPNCVSAWFTDPERKPTWKGKRFRFLVQPPNRQDMWDEYVQMRAANLQSVDDEGNHTDPHGRGSHNWYVANKAQMDAGAVVANPHRFSDQILPDGTRSEVSALQRYYNEVARIGPEAVRTEFDNDPPAEMGPIESGITATRIQKQVSGFDRLTVPPSCVLITQGIDVRKIALHWVVRAWKEDGSGYVIDYGVHEVHGTVYGSDEGLDLAIKRSVMGRMEDFKDTPYGTRMELDRFTLVDAGWRTDAIYAACAEIGVGIAPVMGFGRSSGCIQTNFSQVQRRTKDKKPGDGWFMSRQGKTWLVCADADRWKAWEHDRWMTTPGRAGSLQMFGQPSERPDRLSDDEKHHHAYARHITNETEVEEVIKGVLKRKWKPKSDNVHWFDASYYANVAANMKGIRLMTASTSPEQVGPAKTLAEMAAASGGANG